MESRIAFLNGQLDRLQQFFPRVEGRATFLMALVLAQLGIVAANFPIEQPFGFTAFLGYLTVCCAGLSIWKIYGVLFPHLDPAPRPSLIYFDDIAKRSEIAFAAEIKDAHDAVLVDDLASQIWRNSEILATKFRLIKHAFLAAAFGIPPWLVFLAIVALTSGRNPMGGANG